MKNIAGKTRKTDNPYAVWTDPYTGWEYKLLKSWQGDNSQVNSRWFMWVRGWGTDMGDTYCDEVRGSLNRTLNQSPLLVVFDETVWDSLGAFVAWAWGEQ